MFKYLNFRILLFLVFYFWVDASFAQQKTETLPPPKSAAFKLFFEKVYLQTDRNWYTSGEDLWFKAYLVNGPGTSLTNTSNNLYVELIAADAKIIDREIVRMDNGLGNGDFKLSDTLTSGSYRIRAYTNWMRNFGNNFVFEKAITIQQIPSTATSKTSAQLNKKTPVKTASAENDNGTIRFFPEGGSLIEDVQSVIGFKAEDKNGNGLKVSSASIISSKGDTVSRFQSAASGMGSFAFLPVAGLQYRVKGIFGNNQRFVQALPAALPKGFSLHLNVADTANIKAIISLNAITLADFSGKEITLAGRHGATLCFSAKIKINGLETNVKIPGSSFPAGVAAITLYDEQLRPNCERLIYVEGNEQVTLSILPDKRSYQPKEKVVLHLKTSNSAQQAVSANLSLAALDAAIVPEEQRNIQSYLLLESEVRGKIANAAQYFERINPNRFRQLDLLLLTQGWRDFVWKRLADTTINISYLPEQGFDIEGRLRQKFANQALSNKKITLSVAGSAMSTRYNALSDAAGRFHLDHIELYGKRSITLAAIDEKGKNAGLIELDSAKKTPLKVNIVPGFEADSAIRKKQLQLVEILSKRQSLSDTLRLKEVKIKAAKTVILRDIIARPFGYPDQAFDITQKDFYYETLDNWLAHNVKGAIMSIFPDSNGIVFLGNQTVILPSGFRQKQVPMWPKFIVNNKEVYIADRDPAEMSDAIRSQYYNISMNKIEKVTVRHLVGVDDNANTKDVFLLYLTIKPDALLVQAVSKINTEFDGYYQSRVFYAPKYDQVQQKTGSDFRTTIHWEPNIKTDANGEATVTFYNTSQKNQIRVIAEGITTQGLPAFGKTNYSVQ